MEVYNSINTIAIAFNKDRRTIKALIDKEVIQKKLVHTGIKNGKQVKQYSVYLVPINLPDLWRKG